MVPSQDPSPSAPSTPAPDAVSTATAAAATLATTTSSLGAANRKRKRAQPAPKQQQQQQQLDAASPAPDAQGTPSAEPISKSRFDPSKPIPAHSAPPGWLPVQGLPDFYHTDGISHNRNKYRYTDAVEVAPYVFHSQESPPTCVRVCWEDCSSLLAVTQDGLSIAGDKGYRSARLNVPVREGKWYMEFVVELGGGTDKTELGRAEGSHVRVGWSRREAPLNGPVGLDGYSYGLCDKTGDKVTLSRRKPYGRPFGSGDVVGMYISLPPLRAANPKDPHDPALLRRKRQPVGIKGRTYFEQVEYAPCKEMIALLERGADAGATAKRGPQARPHGAGEDGQDAPPAVRARPVKNLPGSNPRSKAPPPEPSGRPLPTLGRDARIAFFVNGECQGVAFDDIFDFRQLRLTAAQRKAKEKEKKGTLQERANMFDDGTLGYYPFLSLFNHGSVRINAGPDFAFPPPPDVDALLDGANRSDEDVKRTWRPLCERYAEHWAEIRALDALEDEHQHELARQLIETDEKRKVEDERRHAQKESRRLKDQARRLQQKARGGSKLAGSIPPDDEKSHSVPSQPKTAADTPTPAPDTEPLPSLPTPPVVTPDAVAHEINKAKLAKHVKREPATPQVQPQTFQFAPPYVYPGSNARPPVPAPAPAPTPALLSAFDSPPHQPPPPLQRTVFDPIRSAASEQQQMQQQQLQQQQQHYAHQPSHPHAYTNSLGLNQQSLDQRLVVDTGPSGYHPQWNDQPPGSGGWSDRDRGRDHDGVRPMSSGSRPMTSPSVSTPFRYNAGPGMAGGYAPIRQQSPYTSTQQQQQPGYPQQTSYAPIQRHASPPLRPVYRPLSPADLRDGPPPLSPSASRAYKPGSPVAYTLQPESSLRSGASADADGADDDDDRDAVRRRVGYGLWDSFHGMDADIRDDER